MLSEGDTKHLFRHKTLVPYTPCCADASLSQLLSSLPSGDAGVDTGVWKCMMENFTEVVMQISRGEIFTISHFRDGLFHKFLCNYFFRNIWPNWKISRYDFFMDTLTYLRADDFREFRFR